MRKMSLKFKVVSFVAMAIAMLTWTNMHLPVLSSSMHTFVMAVDTVIVIALLLDMYSELSNL